MSALIEFMLFAMICHALRDIHERQRYGYQAMYSFRHAAAGYMPPSAIEGYFAMAYAAMPAYSAAHAARLGASDAAAARARHAVVTSRYSPDSPVVISSLPLFSGNYVAIHGQNTLADEY